MKVSRAQLIWLLNMEKELEEMIRPVQDGFDYQDWPIWEYSASHETKRMKRVRSLVTCI